jgi:hypothetical protein
LLLQVFYSIRSERLLMEQLDYNLLFRWFVGLGIDDAVWSPTTFTKNRDRLLDGDIAAGFFEAVLIHADTAQLLSHEHFTVDGTLLEAWASHKSFQPRDTPPDPPAAGGANPTVDFRGTRRSNVTHASRTDPDARLYRKSDGRPAQLAYAGHLLMENRCGLLVGARVTPADGYGEREAAREMVSAVRGGRITLAADKAYDYPEFVADLRQMAVTPHVAQHITPRRGSAIDGRTTHHAGYTVSQRKRKLIEQAFGWLKTVAGLRKLHHRGGRLVDWIFTFAAAANNIVRMRSLLGTA